MKRQSFYLKFNYLAIFSIFMLFVLGGIVRATGSGMGCPDWPKCFGEYIPPTSAAGLPDNYKEIFTAERLKKTERFAALLQKLGMPDKAQEILAYEALSESHDFSAPKAYTEYVNRLWGAATGIVVLLAFITSFSFIRKDKAVFIFTTLGFLAVMVNALLGAVVVAANLLGGIVTIHFLAAFAAIAFFMIARTRIIKPETVTEIGRRMSIISLVVFATLVLQLIIGTQVREAYDSMEAQGHELTVSTIPMLGGAFNWHRTLAIVSLLLFYLQFNELRIKHKQESKLIKRAKLALGLILAQIVFGSLIVMTDWSAFSKLFHISIGAALFILQFYICTPLFKRSSEPIATLENS